MTPAPRVLEVADLDFSIERAPWAFAKTQADRIAAFWRRKTAANPRLFNGRVLLLARHAFSTRADGGLVLGGAFVEVDFAAFLAWRDFGFPGEPVCNGFAMAALRSGDGAYLLGEMAAHTSNAGKIYFPAGTPDPKDVFGDRVDLDASARRELHEETGVAAEETSVEPGWTVVYAPPYIACMRTMTLDAPAEAIRARVDAFLAGDPNAELTRLHVTRRAGELAPERTLPFISAFLRTVLPE